MIEYLVLAVVALLIWLGVLVVRPFGRARASAEPPREECPTGTGPS